MAYLDKNTRNVPHIGEVVLFIMKRQSRGNFLIARGKLRTEITLGENSKSCSS